MNIKRHFYFEKENFPRTHSFTLSTLQAGIQISYAVPSVGHSCNYGLSPAICQLWGGWGLQKQKTLNFSRIAEFGLPVVSCHFFHRIYLSLTIISAYLSSTT